MAIICHAALGLSVLPYHHRGCKPHPVEWAVCICLCQLELHMYNSQLPCQLQAPENSYVKQMSEKRRANGVGQRQSKE